MNKLNFSFRDYISYMLPGALAIFSGFLVDPTGMDWLEAHKFVSGLMFLLGGYILGSFLNGIAHALVISEVDKQHGTPTKILSGKKSRFFDKFDSVFEKQLRKVLIQERGEELVNEGSEEHLLLLCLRKSQTIPHLASDNLERLVSLYQFYATMIIAIPIASVFLIIGGEILIGLLILPLIYRAIKGFNSFRRQFVENVYGIFFIQHRDKASE